MAGAPLPTSGVEQLLRFLGDEGDLAVAANRPGCSSFCHPSYDVG